MKQRIFTALALGLGLALATHATPAMAQPTVQVAPSTEALDLGRETFRLLLGKVDFQAQLEGKLPSMTETFGAIPGRPEWADLARQAALEESGELSRIMQQRMGERMARSFTIEELRAGVVMLRGPAGQEMATMIAAVSRHEKPPELSDTAKRELVKFGRLPAGRDWLDKFQHIDKTMDQATSDMTADFLIGFMHRFLDKAEQGEAAHHGAG